MENENRKNKKRIVIAIVAILLILFGAVYCGYYAYLRWDAANREPVSEITVAVTEGEKNKTVKNPIDFAALKKKNGDIYAWIKVPGTKVNHPIVQSKADDEFYLKHSAEDKSWLASGAIYTEMCNTRSWNDSVTMVYGHNGYSDTMFTTLHRFEKEEFFKKHKFFYIYTPDAKRTYRIISAFKYDDRHIMNSFDFVDIGVRSEFFKMLENPKSTNKQVASDFNRELNTDDKVVILSTCFNYQPSSRYLVCGVLVKNEKTD